MSQCRYVRRTSEGDGWWNCQLAAGHEGEHGDGDYYPRGNQFIWFIPDEYADADSEGGCIGLAAIGFAVMMALLATDAAWQWARNPREGAG